MSLLFVVAKDFLVEVNESSMMKLPLKNSPFVPVAVSLPIKKGIIPPATRLTTFKPP